MLPDRAPSLQTPVPNTVPLIIIKKKILPQAPQEQGTHTNKPSTLEVHHSWVQDYYSFLPVHASYTRDTIIRYVLPPKTINLQWLLKVNVVSISEIGRTAFECELAHELALNANQKSGINKKNTQLMHGAETQQVRDVQASG